MFEQGREILPVATSDIERQIQIEHEILAHISESLTDPSGLSDESRAELHESRQTTLRSLASIAEKMMRREQYAA